MHPRTFAVLFALLAGGPERVDADVPPPATLRNILYADVEGHALKLDLYRPPGIPRQPLIVWVHGGAWRSGSKSEMPLGALVNEGYAVASVDYRLSTQARFPAQIHDLKAAIRFLRARGAEWGVPTRRIAIAGNSAGAHLAVLAGVTNGDTALEGSVGNNRTESSAIQAIISFYGASNLTTILRQSTAHGLKVRVPALELFLGGQPEKLPREARLASPVFHVDSSDPPLLVFHGEKDPQMPIAQADELCAAYKEANLRVDFRVLAGAGHGGPEFYDAAQMATVKEFLQRNSDS